MAQKIQIEFVEMENLHFILFSQNQEGRSKIHPIPFLIHSYVLSKYMYKGWIINDNLC